MGKQFMKASVAKVQKSTANLRPWRYYSKLQLEKGVKEERTFMNPSLDLALEGWSKICAKAKITDVMSMDGIPDRRKSAEAFAEHALNTLQDGAFPSNSTMLAAMRLWGFEKNISRENVFPDGSTWVHSDALGLIESRDHRIMLASASFGHPNFQRLLILWARGRLPAEFRARPFPCTTIAFNKGYAARMHRDRGNEGPSVGISLGSFVGGGLRYWPDDCKHGDVELMRSTRSTVLDLNKKAVVFDGTNAHEVQPFKGERFSVIFFTIRKYKRADHGVRAALKKAGYHFSSAKSLQSLRQQAPQLSKHRKGLEE